MLRNRSSVCLCIIVALGVLASLAEPAWAAKPVVKTVPWVATNPLIPHDTWVGKTVALKGTSDLQGATIVYTWDFGDGSPVATGTVTDKYAIEALHAYSGPTGTVYTARLTVQDTNDGQRTTANYFIAIRDKALPVEVNVAIDEGLWYLHKAQYRYSDGGVEYGHWLKYPDGPGYEPWYWAITPANVNAFEVNGHLETGDASNPYVETVQRGMRHLFTSLATVDPYGWGFGLQTNGLGTFNPDSNGNGVGVFVYQGNPYYQGGIFMDAIVASGTPNAVTTTGELPSGSSPGIRGRTYKSIVQDMVDAYAFAQYDYSPAGGGWRYSTNEWPDNSACQWAAIGIIAAERNWGCIVPQIVKDWNKVWLSYSQYPSTGWFGYTDYWPVWNAYATTPSGMVQMAMDGIGRGVAGSPSWNSAETHMRDNFANQAGAGQSPKEYFYGLFSFVKSMLLHNVNGVPSPIQFLQSTTSGVNPIDWYSAERNLAQPNGVNNTDGVARTLVNTQQAGGYWWGNNYYYYQYHFETAWAIIMLNRTLFEAGAPVAVAEATPNPAVVGQVITLSGAGSFHQDSSKSIDSWEWDFGNDGSFEVSGPVTTVSYAAIGDYPVRLRVTDNGSPEKSAETVITIRVTTPPVAPTANAGGPYNFCTNKTPFFLDGRGSVNPDEGKSEPGKPGDTIQEYAWDLDGDLDFDDAFGSTPNVTADFVGMGPGNYLIQLRVKDTTSISFPSSGYPDLTDTDSGIVRVLAATDPACSCVTDLTARAKINKAELRWTPRAGAVGYNIYRSTISGGPYIKVGAVAGTAGFYLDQPLKVGFTYYWVVRETALNGDELCQSNQASAKMTSR